MPPLFRANTSLAEYGTPLLPFPVFTFRGHLSSEVSMGRETVGRGWMPAYYAELIYSGGEKKHKVHEYMALAVAYF